MQFIILNDTHTGIRNSSDIFIEYQRRFYEEIFFPYCLENNIKKVLHLGDAFEHRRFVNFKALNSYRRSYLDRLREYGMTMDIIPGNHDVYYKNTLEVCALKELMGHYTDCVTIHMNATTVDYDGLKVGLVPWICQDNEKEIDHFLDTCDAPIIGGHFELAGFEVMKGMTLHEGMSCNKLRRFETVLSGHFHTKSHQGNVHYLGSQMEFFWNDAGDPKFMHVFDTETRELTPVQNPLTLFEKVLYDDEKINYNDFDTSVFDNKFVKVIVINKNDPFTFDRFLDRISNQKIHDLKIQENLQEWVGDNVADSDLEIEDTSELLRGYVDAVETVLDKDRLKNELVNLMTEAETFEIS